MKHTSAYSDDIIVTSITPQEHLPNLEEVLKILKASGLCHNKEEKCFFLRPRIVYFCHAIDKDRLNLTQAKVQVPQNITQLCSFLGLINYYYKKLLPNLSSTLSSLYFLLNKEWKWHWG